jgi:hypothetical protein
MSPSSMERKAIQWPIQMLLVLDTFHTETANQAIIYGNQRIHSLHDSEKHRQKTITKEI